MAVKDQDKVRKGSPWFLLAVCLPLFAGLALFWLGPGGVVSEQRLQTALVGYAVAVLGFFAGTRYGILVGEARFYARENAAGTARHPFAGALRFPWLVPFLAGPLLGLGILLMPFVLALAVLSVAFGAFGAWDAWAAFRGRLPPGYARQRAAMTWVICLALIAIFVIEGTR